MLQQVMTAPGVIEFREVPIPEPKAGEVLVKIMRIGVCGSWKGSHQPPGGTACHHRATGGMRQVLPLPPWQIQSLRGTQGDGVPDHWYRQRIFCGGCG